MNKTEVEPMIGITSAYGSYFLDCLAIGEDVLVDEGMLKTMEQITETVETTIPHPNPVIMEPYKQLQQTLRNVLENGFGCYEPTSEDCHTLFDVSRMMYQETNGVKK